MSSDNIVFVIDAGNTSVKTGHYVDDSLVDVRRFANSKASDLYHFLEENNAYPAVLSSVLTDADTAEITRRIQCLKVNSTTPIPIRNAYGSIATLGIDRLCNAVAVFSQLKKGYGVSIDIGTCIKFDLVSKEGEYLGGSISPGIDLRYKSLNDYTGNLPLISNKSETPIVGTDTETSIRSGVINGIKAEIAGLMDAYSKQYQDLTFFMTGGDAEYFDIHSKNDIFADENLTLRGLYEIYKHNA